MEKNLNWVLLEPTVEVVIIGKSCLLYDTVTGNNIHILNNSMISQFIKKLVNNNNCIKFDILISNDEINNFIGLLRERYMGDIIPVHFSKRKPIQLTGIVNIQRDFNKLKNNDDYIYEKDLLYYVNTLNLFLNSEKNSSYIKDAGLQFLYCSGNEYNNSELNFYNIINFLNKFNLKVCSRMNILGSNIINYTMLSDLLEFIDRYIFNTFIYLNINTYNENKTKYDKLFIELSSNKNYNIIIFVNPGYQFDKNFNETISKLNNINISYEISFIIENETDLQKATDCIEALRIVNKSFHPYYNGSNDDFFKEFVYLSKEDITEQSLSQKNIDTLKTINSNFFGNLLINSKGNIYSSFNTKSYGNIVDISIHDSLYDEFKNRKLWLKTKAKIKPCSKCLYKTICPPISNYELYLKKNNLCTVL